LSSSVFQVASEFKSVSSDIRLVVKDAVSAVIENLQEKGGDIKEEITASIEGAIEGLVVGDASLSKFRQKLISYRIE